MKQAVNKANIGRITPEIWQVAAYRNSWVQQLLLVPR